MKDEAALISLNLFNFLNTCHCIRVLNFISMFKLGANKHFVGNIFHACEPGNKVFLSIPRVLLALFEIFVTCLSRFSSLDIVTPR